MKAILIYVTVPTEAEAQKIAEAVVADRLAACANIIPGMKSIHRWEGKMTTASETVLIFKTHKALFKGVEARVKALHSYDTPCIVALPTEDVNEKFMRWLLAETLP